ncbi:uncharacterized protein LOC128559440 [Mercenaria mercenaria]|uniref:uncharacterized protein LOC128559440 n=1 Tax=Mercenaria mercenaria TaxID=6596 RepID=UPI00234FAEEB|nr:uncharacterized protein LOC128559440 [Mercenaria mercenaria]
MGRFMQPVILLPAGREQSCRHTSIEGLLASLLGGLYSHSLLENQCRRGWPMLEPRLSYSAVKQPWIHVLDMAGFRPEEINVKVKDNLVSVHAKHEEVDGEDVDITEKKRSVHVPEGVNVTKIACFVDRGGKLVIKAPFSTAKLYDGRNKCELKVESTEGNTEQKLDESQREQQCDSMEVSEKSSTEPFHDELNREKDNNELQQLSTDCPKSMEPADKETQDCRQINVADDMLHYPLETNIEGHLTSDCTDTSVSPVPLIEKTENGIDNGEQDVGTDIFLDKGEPLDYLMDKTDIVEKNGQKYFCAKINFENFPRNSIRVLCEDKTLSVDATREWDDSGVKVYQEFHRQYKLPNNSLEAEARAFVSGNGRYFTVNVPIKEECSTEKPAE